MGILQAAASAKKGIAVADLTYKLHRLSDYPVIPSTERLIDPYLPLGGQIVLAALPKTFKTYVALSWCCCVVTGHPWLDQPVKKGKQGNRVKKSCGDETCEELVVPSGDLALEAE